MCPTAKVVGVAKIANGVDVAECARGSQQMSTCRIVSLVLSEHPKRSLYATRKRAGKEREWFLDDARSAAATASVLAWRSLASTI